MLNNSAHFVQRVLLIVLLSGSLAAQTRVGNQPAKASNNTKPIIGLQLYSFRNEMKVDLEGTLAKVKAMGVTEVEASMPAGVSVADFKKLLDKYGFKNISYFADYKRMGDDLAGVIADAKTLDSKYVVVAWIPHHADFTLADCNQAIANFSAWGEQVAKAGLKFAYHIHGYEFQPYGNGTLFDKMMAETKPQFVKVEMDVFWVAHPGQDPVKLLEKYGSRTELLHVKDMQKGLKGDLTGHADVETNVTIGEGQLNFPAIFRAAKKAGVKYAFIEDESSRSMQQVPPSLSYLRSL